MLVEGCLAVNLNPLLILFPSFVKFKIGKTNQINARNADRLISAIDKFVHISEDKNSLYRVLNREGVTDHDGAIQDLLGLLLAGMDTTS